MDDKIHPIHDFALQRDWRSVLLLLDKGVDPDIQTIDGFTPLTFAAASGSVEIVQVLLNRGANPTLRTEQDIAVDWSLNQAVFALLKPSAKEEGMQTFPFTWRRRSGKVGMKQARR